jgi:uncharacterized membrane protein YkgB
MIKNMGSTDRIIRVVIALVIAGLYFAGMIGGTLAIILGIVAVVFLLTSLVGVCPGYFPFRLSTKRPSGGPPPAA